MPKASASPAPRIRKAQAGDLPAVERIEREQFSNPWQREYYAAELKNSFSHFFVIEGGAGSEAVGYMLFWRLGGELELHKIAVGRAWQRQGHAARLLECFMQAARDWGCERAVLEVRESNVAAIRLYEKFAFRLAGRRSAYYTRPDEDALIYEFDFRGPGEGL